MEDKNSIKYTIIIGILIILFELSGPLWISNFEWDLCVSIAGTLVSVTALILAVIEINGVKKANVAIKDAVNVNSKAIHRIGNVYDIARHAQMIHEIQGFINAEKWEIAHLRLLELRAILENIKSNIAEYGVELRDIQSHISNVSEDLRSLNKTINKTAMMYPEGILDHLDAVSPFLTSICTNLRKNSNDNKTA